VNSPVKKPFLLLPGEKYSFSTDIGGITNFWVDVIEYDATDTTLMGARILSLRAGNNILYRVSEGKSSILSTCIEGVPLTNVLGGLVIVNGSENPQQYTVHVVKKGSVISISNRVHPYTFVYPGQILEVDLHATLNTGDFVVIKASSPEPGQLAYMTPMEM